MKYIKQFLKPNRKKVIIFIIIFILLVVFREFFESNIFFLNQLIRAPFLFLTFPFYFLILSASQSALLAIIGLIIGISGLIFWYFISCLIVWIYEKFKKKFI